MPTTAKYGTNIHGSECTHDSFLAIFKIKNSCLTLAEVSFQERMKISHRAKSTQEMLKHLNHLYK